MNNEKRKKRINSFELNKNSLMNNDESSEDQLNKTMILKNQKEMISYKNIQNIDLTTYDYIFIGRQINNEILQDFDSFKRLLNNIKKDFNPKVLQNNINIENLIKDEKFCFNNNNLNELLLIDNNKSKEIEISINNRYIKTKNSYNFYNLYGTKSFFKGKHCFEIEILNINNIDLSIGIINTSFIDIFKYINNYRNDYSEIIKKETKNIHISELKKSYLKL